jgi:hypothetical protein
MTTAQEQAITLALNVLQVGFFECTRQDYQYFISNDEWALLLTAAGLNAVDTPPQEVAVAVLNAAVARRRFFEAMTDFRPPKHFCSFLREQIRLGKRSFVLGQCQEGQRACPYATLGNISESR